MASLAWQDDAACREIGAELFYANDTEERVVKAGYETRQAKKICNSCPVQEACLEYALDYETPSKMYGIWGGATPRERAEIKAKRNRASQRIKNREAMRLRRSKAMT